MKRRMIGLYVVDQGNGRALFLGANHDTWRGDDALFAVDLSKRITYDVDALNLM